MAGRKKLHRKHLHVRVSDTTAEKLHEIALTHGYGYGSGASIGAFLDAIADKQLRIIPESVWHQLYNYFSKTD